MSGSIWQCEGSLASKFWADGKADIPIYDMHGHMGPVYGVYLKRNSPADMVAMMRKVGIRHLVFCHHDIVQGSMRNEEAIRICEQYPDILRAYLGINPNYPDLAKEDLARLDQWSPYAVGLKILPSYHTTPANGKGYEYSLSFADERGLPVLVHTWGGDRYNGGPIMLDTVQKYPHVKFFIAHCIFGEWEYAQRVVKESAGNVWLDLTAVPGERGIIEMLVDGVGSERIIYGTDTPWFDESQAIGGVLSARISEEDKHNILYRNVERILGTDW